MPIEIKHHLTKEVLHTVYAETLRGANLRGDSLRGAETLRGADLSCDNLSDANLSYADLRGADLSYANLCDANLSYANLSDANLSDASLWNCAGNGRELKTVQTGIWQITYSAEVIQIGCQQHSIEAWKAFSDEEIAKMDVRAFAWWKVWKPVLMQIIEVSPAKPTKAKEG